jgi:integrase
MMAKLTDRALTAAKPKDVGYKLTVDRGLYLRVAPSGEKVWLVRYVIGGKQIQTRLPRPFKSSGDGFMSLAQACAENSRIQSLARDGVDFQRQRDDALRAQAAEAAAAEVSDKPVQTMFEAWLADGVARKDGNEELRRSFTKDVLPAIGTKPVRVVTEHDLRALLRAMVKRGVQRMTIRTYKDLVQLFAWAEKRKPWSGLMADGNPAALLEIDKILPVGSDAEMPRERVLSPAELKELRELFANMESAYAVAPAGQKYDTDRPLKKESQLALWIALGTACRIGELLMARWEHVDLATGEWFVPAGNTKTGADWRVFLSDFALDKFKSLHALTGETPFCFPARVSTDKAPELHVCVKSVSKQIGDRQVQFKQRAGPMSNRRHDNTLVLAEGANGKWTPHDLRRTAATMMQSLRITPEVIDACQNHVLAGSKVRRHYLHYDYADEKREAWQKLGDRLNEILGSAGTSSRLVAGGAMPTRAS